MGGRAWGLLCVAVVLLLGAGGYLFWGRGAPRAAAEGPAAGTAADNGRIYRQRISEGRDEQIRGQSDSALWSFAGAEALADSSGLYSGACEARIKIGEIVYDHGNYDSALTWFLQAQRIADAHGLRGSKAYALYYIGKYTETKGRFKEASADYDSALAICREENDPHLLVLILTSRGKNFISEGRLNLAMQYYLEAFELSEQMHDDMLYAQTASHLGSLYSLLNMYDKALEYDRRAFVRRDDLDNPEGIAKSCNNIGILFHKLNQNDSAIAYFDEALALCRRTHYKKGLVKALVNIGIVYSDQADYAKAFHFLDTAFRISNQAGFGYGIASSSVNLAALYKKQDDLPRALAFYRLSLSRLAGTDFDEMLVKIYQGLYDCYSAQRDFETALHFHVLLLETEKRLLNVENARELSVLNINYDLERKVKDNEVLRADNELKQAQIKRKTIVLWLIVVALGFTLLVCLSIYNRLYLKKKANTALARLNDQLEMANREKDKLFSIISHELRNPLYWTQNLAEMLSKKFREMPAEKLEKSLSSLDESARNAFHLMDNLLQWSRSKLKRIHPRKGDHALQGLVADTAEMFQTIVRYKEICFTNAISAECRVHADADILCCVIRNLLSNAIKYTPAGGVIEIGETVRGAEVCVVVRDSGSGIGAGAGTIFSGAVVSAAGLMQEKGSGIGLKLCKDFVELNGGRIWVESQEGWGTSIFFTVPVEAAAGSPVEGAAACDA